jgi:prepilin-type N-terminal cleavage/methylation domain-containing protein
MKNNNNNKNILKSSSFTLIELIIVLAIISILVTILIATIKPIEIFKKTRDSKRIADLKNIEKTIDLLYSTYPNFNELNYASTNIVYISLKDDSPTCSSYISQLPSLPPGYQYRCSANPQNIDGTGWIPIPFNNFDIINLANLPIDPINKPPYYYTFVVGGSYAVYAQLEDPKNQASKNDQDNYPHLYSVGTNKRLIDQAQGLVGYWPFDEGSGTIAKDYSGNGNDGTLVNGPTWVDGKVGKALSFDGVDDYVQIPLGTGSLGQGYTILAWFYPRESDNYSVLAGWWGFHIGLIVYGTRGYHAITLVRPDNSLYSDAIYPSETPMVNSWTFGAALWSKPLMWLFQNDKKYGPKSEDPSYNLRVYSSNFRPGFSVYSGQWFAGVIDEVRIYNRALSDSEIKALYDATK